jgi:hypothetical protein
MPPSDQGQNQSGDNRGFWRIEWVVSSGLGASLVAGLLWVGSIDEKVANLKDTVSKLDNYTLGNRITALEVALRHADVQQDRVERKIDRLLERRYGTGSGPAPTGNQDQ